MNARALSAEFIGVFAMVFFGCGAQRSAELFSPTLLPFGVDAAFGFAVGLAIFVLRPASGAHFNPAVTLAFFASKRFPFHSVVPYWSAQFLGGIFGAGALAFLLPKGTSFGNTIPRVPAIAAFSWEAALTFFLILVIMAVAKDETVTNAAAGGLIGGTVVLCGLTGGPATGAGMNPARALGPAIAQGEFHLLWAYFLGPFLGAITAAPFFAWISADGKGKCQE